MRAHACVCVKKQHESTCATVKVLLGESKANLGHWESKEIFWFIGMVKEVPPCESNNPIFGSPLLERILLEDEIVPSSLHVGVVF